MSLEAIYMNEICLLLDKVFQMRGVPAYCQSSDADSITVVYEVDFSPEYANDVPVAQLIEDLGTYKRWQEARTITDRQKLENVAHEVIVSFCNLNLNDKVRYYLNGPFQKKIADAVASYGNDDDFLESVYLKLDEETKETYPLLDDRVFYNVNVEVINNSSNTPVDFNRLYAFLQAGLI